MAYRKPTKEVNAKVYAMAQEADRLLRKDGLSREKAAKHFGISPGRMDAFRQLLRLAKEPLQSFLTGRISPNQAMKIARSAAPLPGVRTNHPRASETKSVSARRAPTSKTVLSARPKKDRSFDEHLLGIVTNCRDLADDFRRVTEVMIPNLLRLADDLERVIAMGKQLSASQVETVKRSGGKKSSRSGPGIAEASKPVVTPSVKKRQVVRPVARAASAARSTAPVAPPESLPPEPPRVSSRKPPVAPPISTEENLQHARPSPRPAVQSLTFPRPSWGVSRPVEVFSPVPPAPAVSTPAPLREEAFSEKNSFYRPYHIMGILFPENGESRRANLGWQRLLNHSEIPEESLEAEVSRTFKLAREHWGNGPAKATSAGERRFIERIADLRLAWGGDFIRFARNAGPVDSSRDGDRVLRLLREVAEARVA